MILKIPFRNLQITVGYNVIKIFLNRQECFQPDRFKEIYDIHL